MLVKLLNNRLVQLILTAIALYFAYTTVDISSVLSKIRGVPLWFGVFLIAYGFVFGIFGTIRWTILLFDKLKWKDVWTMYKASLVASFYSMFLPTPLAGDGLKWVKSAAAFEEIPKIKILASIMVDRVVGLSTLVFMGGFSLVLATVFGYQVPEFMRLLIFGSVLGVVMMGLVIYFFDFDKLSKKFSFLNKFAKLEESFRLVSKKRLGMACVVSFLIQIVWILPVYFTSLWFVPGLPILVIYAYIPIISLMLALPISFGGFGAREALYTTFFGALGYNVDSLLAMSSYMGVVQLVSALISGLFVVL